MNNLHRSAQIVEPNWLARPSTEVAPDLVGCTLVRQLSDGNILRGMIVETEAYGPRDPACHAYRRRTQRNWVMFGSAGRTLAISHPSISNSTKAEFLALAV